MNSKAHHFTNAAQNGALKLVSILPQPGRLDAPSDISQQPDTTAIMGMLQELLQERAQSTRPAIPISLLQCEFTGWMVAARSKKRSRNTLDNRRRIWGNFVWWLGYDWDRLADRYTERLPDAVQSVDKTVIEEFLVYVSEGTPEGRWGDPKLTAECKPSTLQTYFAYLCAYFSYLVKQDIIPASPMDKIDRPEGTKDQIKPFTEEQIVDLVCAADKTDQPLRNVAVVWLLFDTGMRVSELCALNIEDIDLRLRRVEVLGKGNKRRTLYFNDIAYMALWRHIRHEDRPGNTPLFVAANNRYRGKRMTRSGVYQIVRNLGDRLGLSERMRTSPHTIRHSYAVTYLRDGGREKSLMNFLGHTSLTMTSRYVNFADADLEDEHREHSPADRAANRRRR